MTATTFVLFLLIGTQPAQQRGEFPDYQRCAEAAVGPVESLRSIEHVDVEWQCVPAPTGFDAIRR